MPAELSRFHTRRSLRADLEALGPERGDAVLVHAALRDHIPPFDPAPPASPSAAGMGAVLWYGWSWAPDRSRNACPFSSVFLTPSRRADRNGSARKEIGR